MKKLLSVILSGLLLVGCSDTASGHDELNRPEEDKITITNSVTLNSQRVDMSEYKWIGDRVADFEKISIADSVRLFAENGSGVLYYGYPGCQWCERAIPELNKVMNELDLPVYYIDASIMPDQETYNNLLSYVKDDLRKDENGEPEFNVPYVVGVKKGKLVASHTSLIKGYSIQEKDQMSDAQKEELQEDYREIFRAVAD